MRGMVLALLPRVLQTKPVCLGSCCLLPTPCLSASGIVLGAPKRIPALCQHWWRVLIDRWLLFWLCFVTIVFLLSLLCEKLWSQAEQSSAPCPVVPPVSAATMTTEQKQGETGTKCSHLKTALRKSQLLTRLPSIIHLDILGVRMSCPLR